MIYNLLNSIVHLRIAWMIQIEFSLCFLKTIQGLKTI